MFLASRADHHIAEWQCVRCIDLPSEIGPATVQGVEAHLRSVYVPFESFSVVTFGTERFVSSHAIEEPSVGQDYFRVVEPPLREPIELTHARGSGVS